MEEVTPRFNYGLDTPNSQDDLFYSGDRINLKIKKNKHEHSKHKSFLKKTNTTSKSKDSSKKKKIFQTLKKFCSEEFDPEKDYEQYHCKRFLLPKIKVFSGQNLENEELFE